MENIEVDFKLINKNNISKGKKFCCDNKDKGGFFKIVSGFSFSSNEVV